MSIFKSSAWSKRKFLKVSVAGAGATFALAGCATLGLSKIAKANAGYEDHPHGADHCHDCEHFENPQSCTVVEGTISPRAVCHYFLKKT